MCIIVKYGMENTPTLLLLMLNESKCKRFGHKQLLRLTGSPFVISVKIQLWQHKVTPFPVKFWVWFGSSGIQKCSRNVGLAL